MTSLIGRAGKSSALLAADATIAANNTTTEANAARLLRPIWLIMACSVDVLIQRNIERFDHARPARAVLVDEFVDLGLATWTHRREADLVQRSAERVISQGAIEARRNLLRDLIRHLRQRRNAVPDRDCIIGITTL